MKIAIFHNYMDNIGGAEIVTLILARELRADIYTTNIDMEKIKKMGFNKIKIFSIGKVPINAPFRQQLALWKFRKLNLKNKYDFYIISGDWAVSGVINNKPNLYFMHSPLREFWDLYEYIRKNLVPWYKRWLFDLWVKYNRFLNKKYINNVDKLVCNSMNTKKRAEKFLGKSPKVIYPPTDTKKYHYKKNGNYWLSVNRLLPNKRIDVQIKAFKKLPNEKLIIIGSYEGAAHFQQCLKFIRKIKPQNVEILHWVDSNKLIEFYANCRGFITTAMDEDFGMTPIEAMASGKPVVAPDEGGYRESVINGKTGILIKDITADKLVKAIKKVGKNPKKFKKACLERAKEYDTKKFIKKIKQEIDDILK